MNQFRNIFTVVLFLLGIGLFLTDPADWRWVDSLGQHAVDTARFLGEAKPFSYILCWVISLALFMTRKQY